MDFINKTEDNSDDIYIEVPMNTPIDDKHEITDDNHELDKVLSSSAFRLK